MRPMMRMTAASVIAPLAALVVSPVLARSLGVNGRGIYAALTMPILMLGIAGTFGVQDGLSYFIAQHGLRPRRALRYLARTLPLASLITLTFGAAVGWLLFHGRQGHLLLLFMVLLATVPVQI